MQDIDFKQPLQEKTISAKEARKMVENAILSSSNQTKKKIDDLIIAAIKKKVFSVTFVVPDNGELEILKKYYADLGYTWQQKDGQRDNDYIVLSW